MLWATPGGMNKYIGSRTGADQSVADPPLALALQHVEGFFLNTMDVKAGRKAGRHCPVKHAGVLRVLSGHEERHRLAGQGEFLPFTWHSNDYF